jgi:hypothetical protein
VGFLLLQIIPVAVGIAVNPVPIIAALIMAGTRRPVANGGAFVAALVVVMALFGGVVLVLVPTSTIGGGGAAEGYIEAAWLLVGLGFVAAFVVVAVRKPAPGRGDREPRWMALIERMGPAGAAIVGVLLVNYEMQAPALADILHAHLSLVQAFVALTVFIAIAASTPAVPLALSIAAPGRVLAAMGPVKTWLTAHNRPILLAVFGVVGVIYTIKGVLAVMH